MPADHVDVKKGADKPKDKNLKLSEKRDAPVAKWVHAMDLGSIGQPCRFESCLEHHRNLLPLVPRKETEAFSLVSKGKHMVNVVN